MGVAKGVAAQCGFSGCMIRTMASPGQESESLNSQFLVDSIPAMIHTARPDGYLDYSTALTRLRKNSVTIISMSRIQVA
jgi:hypothetical protein